MLNILRFGLIIVYIVLFSVLVIPFVPDGNARTFIATIVFMPTLLIWMVMMIFVGRVFGYRNIFYLDGQTPDETED